MEFPSPKKISMLSFDSHKALSFSSPIPDDSTISNLNEEDLFVSFRGLLILGRFLGVVPISGLFKRSSHHLQANLFSVPGLTSIACALLLSIYLAIKLVITYDQPKESILDIAKSVVKSSFAGWCLFAYVYFIIRRHEFLEIFKIWMEVSKNLAYTEKDKTLYRTIVIISVIMFSSTFLENAVLHMIYFKVFDGIHGHIMTHGNETENDSWLQKYYSGNHEDLKDLLGYHPIFAILAFFINKLNHYGSNYVDVTMALFFRALYFKFEALNKLARKKLLKPDRSYEPDNLAWNQLVKDHDSLCEIMNVMNNFFSPLIFASYATNIYIVCMQIIYAVNPSLEQRCLAFTIYAHWSFIHLVLRFFLLTLLASKVNEHAHNTRQVLNRCPVELMQTGLIAKLDKRVNTGPQLGITGMGCFVITRPFMLSILSTIFTVEIVLLQGVSDGATHPSEAHSIKEISHPKAII